jgi:outer membrane protein OmpA-like peptidoglycan-associated protein
LIYPYTVTILHGLLSLIAGFLMAAAPLQDGADLELEHPQLEQTRILPPEQAEGALKDIAERVRQGELPKVQFDFDSPVLREESFPTLDAIAHVMLQVPYMKMLITAHCCKIGTAKYNYKLSFRRAKSVRDYLIKKGVPPPSIRYRGKGYDEPIADNRTPEGRELNRRVEFHWITRNWSSVY